MTQEAKIIDIRKDRITAGCDKKMCEGCKSSMFCRNTNNTFEVQKPSDITVNKGDTVLLEMNPRKTVVSTLMSLALPLLCFFLGMGAGYLLNFGEVLQFVFGLSGLAVGFAISALYFHFTKAKYMPTIKKLKE